jgi:hypothetical protein
MTSPKPVTLPRRGGEFSTEKEGGNVQVNLKAEILRRLNEQLSSPAVQETEVLHQQAAGGLREIEALREETKKRIEDLKATDGTLAAKLKDMASSPKEAIKCFGKKREAARGLRDAEEDLKDIDAVLFPSALEREKKARADVLDSKLMAVTPVNKWACGQLQALIEEADDLYIAWCTALGEIANGTLFSYHQTLKLRYATNQLVNLFEFVPRRAFLSPEALQERAKQEKSEAQDREEVARLEALKPKEEAKTRVVSWDDRPATNMF